MFKAGSRRKIGNGVDTNVWQIPWLLDVGSWFITTPMPYQLKDITVRSLMDDTERAWDIEVIDDVFNSHDAALIKRVPIPTSDNRDGWYWVLGDKGDSTVKSAYRWL